MIDVDLSYSDILTLAKQRAREQYIVCRRGQELLRGNPNYVPDGKFNKKYESQWPIIAEFALKNRLDPATCVDVRFAATPNRQVTPDQIAIPRYLEIYKSSSEFRDGDLRQMLASDEASFQTEVTLAKEAYRMPPKDAWVYVLSNEGLSMSALFRLCAAVSGELPSIVTLYKFEAFFQYFVAAKAYDTAWRGMLPKQLKSNVRYLMNRLKRKRRRKPKRRADVED